MLHGSLPVRPPSYDKKIGLVLQGGGALGSYQAGVYEALASSEYLPDWVAGISIGAINAAIIVGNTPENRVKHLRNFWQGITASTRQWPSALGEATSNIFRLHPPLARRDGARALPKATQRGGIHSRWCGHVLTTGLATIMAPHSSTGSTWCGNMYCAPSVSARVKFSADDNRLSGLESADDDVTERRCISTPPGNDCGGRSRASFIARRRPTRTSY